MSDILVITTGGTIGALPVKDIDQMPHIKDMPPEGDVVEETLKTVFQNWKIRCVSLEPRDSNFIDQDYRNNIAGIIEKANEGGVIITHGTDTILETAQFFHHRTKANADLYKSKRIIITGAMVPLANGAFSDGYKNIEFSLDQLSSGCCPLSIVLCGYDTLGTEEGEWKPRLYPFEPNKYQRYYDRKYPIKDGLAPKGYSHGREPPTHQIP